MNGQEKTKDIFTRGKPVIAVELDPPADDDAAFFMDGVQEIRDAGADLITIADCPVGQAGIRH